jgi:hypothetical protein
MGQIQIAALLGLSRPSVTSGLRERILARLVTKQRNGVYRINAMLASYETPADARAAIDAMDLADRLDDPHFVARYQKAGQDYLAQLARNRRKKLHVTCPRSGRYHGAALDPRCAPFSCASHGDTSFPSRGKQEVRA